MADVRPTRRSGQALQDGGAVREEDDAGEVGNRCPVNSLLQAQKIASS